MVDHMAVRGPDAVGYWFAEDGRTALGHRRLSIIDCTDRANQPMFSEDGRLAVVFNGEIYNYRALRNNLQTKGHVFRSQSDTEVLLHLYADRGAAMVHALRGMFAFAIWDSEKRGLLVARDGYGIKPFYYSDDGKTFRFASQVKALMAGNKLSKAASPAGWVGFYLFGSVPEPHTTYASVRSLPAGATLWIDTAGAAAPKSYFSVAKVYCDAEAAPLQLDDKAFEEHARDALLDSVRHHLVADVPVGSFLSAGIDSSALVGLMRDVGDQSIQTMTVAFEEFRGTPHDESVLAEQVAARYGTRHTTRFVTEHEFHDDLPKILAAMDQPTIDGINTWFVSKAAREQGLKVAISGVGGDELFGGYPSFSTLAKLKRALGAAAWVPGGGPALARFVAMLNRCGMRMHPKTAALLNLGHEHASAYLLLRGLFMPDELGEVLDAGLVAEGLRALRPHALIKTALSPEPKSDYAKVATLESALYMRNQLLRDTDWASMAHSLEVRVPLVDTQLLRSLAPALVARDSQKFKSALARSPKRALPEAVVTRRKTGFATPVATWIQRDARLQSWMRRRPLAAPSYPWARRWACEVQHQIESADRIPVAPAIQSGREADTLSPA